MLLSLFFVVVFYILFVFPSFFVFCHGMVSLFSTNEFEYPFGIVDLCCTLKFDNKCISVLYVLYDINHILITIINEATLNITSNVIG